MHITQLPYLGEHKEKTERVINEITKSIPFSELHEYELAQVAAKSNDYADPYDVLTRKVEHLSQILGCTEHEAECVLFKRIGSKV